MMTISKLRRLAIAFIALAAILWFVMANGLVGQPDRLTNSTNRQPSSRDPTLASESDNELREETRFQVQVSFSGALLERGEIVVGLFDSEQKFQSFEHPIQRQRLKITGGASPTCEFVDLEPGTYAISAFHDRNENAQDKNLIGIPEEQYGFSNNARGQFGRPDYRECEFEVNSPIQLEIKLR